MLFGVALELFGAYPVGVVWSLVFFASAFAEKASCNLFSHQDTHVFYDVFEKYTEVDR